MQALSKYDFFCGHQALKFYFKYQIEIQQKNQYLAMDLKLMYELIGLNLMLTVKKYFEISYNFNGSWPLVLKFIQITLF